MPASTYALRSPAWDHRLVRSATSSSPAFVDFVRDAEALIDDPRAIADRLGALLTEDGWLAAEDRAPGTDSYRPHLLHVSADRRLSV